MKKWRYPCLPWGTAFTTLYYPNFEKCESFYKQQFLFPQIEGCCCCPYIGNNSVCTVCVYELHAKICVIFHSAPDMWKRLLWGQLLLLVRVNLTRGEGECTAGFLPVIDSSEKLFWEGKRKDSFPHEVSSNYLPLLSLSLSPFLITRKLQFEPVS